MSPPMLAPPLQSLYEALYAEPLRKPGLLRARVIAHRAQIEQAAMGDHFVDVDLAYRLVNVCFALLRGYEALDEPARHAVQAACCYFSLDQAGQDDDRVSPTGLADDCEILNYVCHLVDRPDLVVRLE